jgi:hypothetical protein
MKRFIPFAIVAAMILVPTGVVLAAKSMKKAVAAKVTHRSAKQKAANEKLIEKLLSIMEETENKMTFAACIESLAQLKPDREVVVPAIIRKADKMGWLKGDGGEECAVIGDYLMLFLSHKQRRAALEAERTNMPYAIQYPCPCPMPIAPPAYVPPPGPVLPQPCPVPPSPYASYPMTQPMCSPNCPPGGFCPGPIPCPPPPPVPASTWHAAPPVRTEMMIVSAGTTAAQDSLTTELLKILDEAESKVTFALVLEILSDRVDNWEHMIPAIIRKADKMGWMTPPSEDFQDKFVERLGEMIEAKLEKAQKATRPTCTSHGTLSCPAESKPQMKVHRGECTGSGVVGSIRLEVPQFPYPLEVERLPMPRCEVKVAPPMSCVPEMLPMPHVEDQPPFDFGFGWSFN